jgi:hypothetical protein
MRKTRRTTFAGGFAATLLLGFALSLAPGALAADVIEAIESVDRVDLHRRTLMLAGREYHLPAETRIFGANGRLYTLGELKAGNGTWVENGIHEVEFTAMRGTAGDGWVIRSITVLGWASSE